MKDSGRDNARREEKKENEPRRDVLPWTSSAAAPFDVVEPETNMFQHVRLLFTREGGDEVSLFVSKDRSPPEPLNMALMSEIKSANWRTAALEGD